jgi:competence protein ComEC
MNSKLSQMPFLRLIAPLIAGIILALYFPAKSSLIYVITGVSFCLLLLWNWYDSKHQNFSRRWIYGAIAGLFLAIAGYSITLLKQPFHNKFYFEHHLQKGSDSLLVTVLSQPQEKEKTLKTTVEINKVIANGKTTETYGKAIFYFAKDSLAYLIKYGDVLLVHAPLEYVKPVSNPDEFDYKNYLALHGIYREAYVKDNEFAFTNHNNAPWLLSFTNNCREKLISLLNEKIKGDEANIASAILLGYRDDLSQTVIHQFADSGTIHVICVAGLHVGI